LVQIVEIKIPFLAKTAGVSKIRIQARRKEENNCTMSIQERNSRRYDYTKELIQEHREYFNFAFKKNQNTLFK